MIAGASAAGGRMGSFPACGGERAASRFYSPEYFLLLFHPQSGKRRSVEHFPEVAMYRFGHVAHAIGLGEPALRNWLRRNKIDLFEPQPESGWRIFTENDVLVLALAAELVRFGAPVKEAVDAMRSAMGMVNFKTWDKLPNYIYAAPDELGWYASENEALVADRGGPTLVKVAAPIVMSAARKRLLAYEGGAARNAV